MTDYKRIFKKKLKQIQFIKSSGLANFVYKANIIKNVGVKSVDKIIRNRIELSEILCGKIKPICEPLSRVFGIPTFGYRKFFPDGTCFNVSSNFELTKFVQEKFTNAMIPNFEEEVSSTLRCVKHFVLRIGAPDPQNLFLSAIYDWNVWNTLSLYRKNENSVEGFYFTSTRDNYKIVDTYINNIELFEKFTFYFKEKFTNIFSEEKVKKASFPTVSPLVFKKSDIDAFEDQKQCNIITT